MRLSSKLPPLFAAIFVMIGSVQSLLGAMAPMKLRCEDRANPVGVEVMHPRLSWILASGQRGESQTGTRFWWLRHWINSKQTRAIFGTAAK